MKTLQVVQNEINYKGSFRSPLFEVWGAGAPLLQALFSSFSPFGVGLAHIRSEESSNKSPSDQAIVVQLGNWIYRWRIERVELNLTNFNEQDLKGVPKLLDASDDWMEKLGITVAYSVRQFSYVGHFNIEQASAHHVLEPLAHLRLGAGQESRAPGHIFHWCDSDKGWEGDLVIDHSQVVPDGLFVLYSGIANIWQGDHEALVTYLEQRLDSLLSQVGLRLGGR